MSSAVKYLARHPEIKVVLVGGQERLGAIRAIATVLSQELVVEIGVNPRIGETPNVILLDAATAGHVADNVPVLRFDDGGGIYEVLDFDIRTGYDVRLVTPDGELRARVRLMGEDNLRMLAGVVELARSFGVGSEKIKAGIEALRPMAGHLAPREGLDGSVIIDDTAGRDVGAALKMVYTISAPARVLVARELPREAWHFLSATLLAEVLILGEVDAELATLAGKAGLAVRGFSGELELLDYLRTRLEPEAVILLDTPLPI
jgi:UDP-N-acetylmuramyl pentapeptide synthase